MFLSFYFLFLKPKHLYVFTSFSYVIYDFYFLFTILSSHLDIDCFFLYFHTFFLHLYKILYFQDLCWKDLSVLYRKNLSAFDEWSSMVEFIIWILKSAPEL